MRLIRIWSRRGACSERLRANIKTALALALSSEAFGLPDMAEIPAPRPVFDGSAAKLLYDSFRE